MLNSFCAEFEMKEVEIRMFIYIHSHFVGLSVTVYFLFVYLFAKGRQVLFFLSSFDLRLAHRINACVTIFEALPRFFFKMISSLQILSRPQGVHKTILIRPVEYLAGNFPANFNLLFSLIKKTPITVIIL